MTFDTDRAHIERLIGPPDEAGRDLLRDPEDAALIAGRGILYAPDYVVSAGGVINVAVELGGYSEERARAIASRVHSTTLELLEISQELGVSTAEAALRRVEDRIATARVASGASATD